MNPKKPATKLKPKHKKFCREYVIDHKPADAYIRAGYSERGAAQSAHRLLMNADIKAEISRLEAKDEKRTEMTKDWVVEKLKRNENHAFQDGDITTSNKALEMLGKSVGAFTDKVDTTTAVHVIITKPDRTKDNTKG